MQSKLDYKINEISSVKREVEITLPIIELENAIDAMYKQINKTAKIDGFRPGKIPSNILAKHYGPTARTRATSKVVEQAVEKLYKELTEKPLTPPRVEDIDVQKDKKTFSFKVTYEVSPHFDIKEIKDTPIVKKEVQVQAKDIKNMLDKILMQNCTWKKSTGMAKAKSKVNVDFVGTIEGKEFVGGTGAGVDFVVGSKTMLKEFEEGVIGKKAKSEAKIDLDFPANYPAKEVAGKKAQFTIKINSVSNPVLPAIDEKLLSQFGKDLKTEDDLKERIKQTMEIEATKYEEQSFKESVFTAALANYEFEVPEYLINKEAVANLEAAKKKNPQQASRYKLADFIPGAKNKVKLSIIVDKFLKEKQVEITDEEVKERIEGISKTYAEPKEVAKWMNETKDEFEKIRAIILENKLAQRIAKSAKITVEKVSYSKLMEI